MLSYEIDSNLAKELTKEPSLEEKEAGAKLRKLLEESAVASKREPSLYDRLSEMTHDQRLAELMRAMSQPSYAACVAETIIQITKHELKEVESVLETMRLLQKEPPANP